MTEKEKLAALEKTLKDIKDPHKEPLIWSEPIYFPEQFFNFPFFPDYLPENPDSDYIHEEEWRTLVYKLDSQGIDMSKGQFPYEMDKRKQLLDTYLKTYLSKPEHKKKKFLNHFQSMLENSDEYTKPDTIVIMREWLASHLILLENSKNLKSPIISKTTTIEESDNQTRAFIIHFRVQMGDIKSDNKETNFKVIKYSKYLLEAGQSSYQEYRKIIKKEVKQYRIVECCQTIIELEDVDPAVKNQARRFLPR